MGAFILIDRIRNHTMGMGVVEAIADPDDVGRPVAGSAGLSVETVRTFGHLILAIVLAGVVSVMTRNVDAALIVGTLAALSALAVNRFAWPVRLARVRNNPISSWPGQARP